MKVTIPLRQHVGGPDKPIVEVGDKVKRGQLIAKPEGLGANIHSSYDGVVESIDEMNIVIDGDENTDFSTYVKLPQRDTYLETIAEAGIVGAGGAGFPTHVKLKTKMPDGLFIANGAECEALLEHNLYQMENHLEQLIRGVKYCMEIIEAPKGIIAIKGIHTDLVKRINELLKSEDNIELFELPNIYPSGDERALLREVMGIELNPGQLPTEVGACVDNVETIKRICEAIEEGKPYIDKDLTVSGRVHKKENVIEDVPIGTPVIKLIEESGGYINPHGEIVIGGPMTGKPGTEESPVTKISGGVLVAMPFPQEHRKIGILICECGGSEERLTQVAEDMGAKVVAKLRCKRMEEVNGRYRCALPGICPGQAQTVIELKKEGAEVLLVGSCSDWTNTVMGVAPRLGVPVYHHTDHVLRADGHKLYRRMSD